MALTEHWFPPSREHWELLVYIFKFFPLVTLIQWLTTWYPAGKTSYDTRFNIPGKIAWITMEIPGFITVLYIMNTLPAQLGIDELPLENKVMAGMFVVHYLYRAIISPLINPSMSPIHVLFWIFAVIFQLCNGISIGGWLSGYGPTTRADWRDQELNYKSAGRLELGMIIWALGLFSNFLHDDELRQIRRDALKKQKEEQKAQDKSTGKDKGNGIHKVYVLPENLLFRWVLYPHYFSEWIEWTGYWIMGGWGCLPARTFVLNEITTMLPRAVQGKQWYIKRFGKDKVGNRKAAIPGLI